jgi:hypothetical protein
MLAVYVARKITENPAHRLISTCFEINEDKDDARKLASYCEVQAVFQIKLFIKQDDNHSVGKLTENAISFSLKKKKR